MPTGATTTAAEHSLWAGLSSPANPSITFSQHVAAGMKLRRKTTPRRLTSAATGCGLIAVAAVFRLPHSPAPGPAIRRRRSRRRASASTEVDEQRAKQAAFECGGWTRRVGQGESVSRAGQFQQHRPVKPGRNQAASSRRTRKASFTFRKRPNSSAGLACNGVVPHEAVKAPPTKLCFHIAGVVRAARGCVRLRIFASSRNTRCSSRCFRADRR